MKKTKFRIVTFAVCAWASNSVEAHDQRPWIGTWETSPAGLPTVAKIGSYTVPAPITIKGTIRYRLRISQGGSQVRLRFSNEYSEGPLALTAASVALAGEGLNVVPGSLARVTFGGNGAITIPAGAPVLSDPINLPVKSLSDLVVSAYVRDGISMFACSADGTPTDQAVVDGSDATLLEHLAVSKCMHTMRPIVSEIDVLADAPRKVVVTLGDSITYGGVDPKTGERGWPGALSRRLQSAGISVVNAGIGGNRLLQPMSMFGVPALSRLDRDVLSVPGLKYIVLLEGINDIGMSGPGGMFGDAPLADPQELIAAYSQVIARAHERDIKVIGATILPFEGAEYYSVAKERVRATVNEWIRTSKRFDGIIDFDAGMRDPINTGRLKAEYDIGDHLHPNSTGYRAMGELIDIRIFNR